MPEQMIVSAQPEASEAGARVLMAGGNAVDAAMVAALVQGVVDPQMCGIAGFGSCQIYAPKQGVHTCIDFHGRTPLAATPEMWGNLMEGEARDGFGFVLRGNVNDLGYGSVTTPGSLKAYAEAVDEFGTWDWPDVVAPAVRQAERGFVVRPHVHYWWTHGADMGRAEVTKRLGFSETGRRIYMRPDGTPKKIGERVENPDLARTLALIARDDGIAGVLNRNGLKTGHGHRFTRERVTALRSHSRIPVFCEGVAGAEPWLNLSQAAALIGVAARTLRLAAERGEVDAVHPLADGPWVFSREDLESSAIRSLARQAPSRTKHPAVPNPAQQSLFVPIT